MQIFKPIFLYVQIGLSCLLVSSSSALAQAAHKTQKNTNDAQQSAQTRFPNTMQNNYTIGPPELSVPDGKPGAVRRSIRQFYNWTLICDADLTTKKEVCNVSQAVWAKDNSQIFSWSLAAAQDGTPFLLLRAKTDADTKKPIEVAIKGTKAKFDVKYVGCSRTYCLGQTKLSNVLVQAIGKKMDVVITYKTLNNQTIQFEAPLKGLREALEGVK